MPGKPLESIVDSIFGYDFFISYSHADGQQYPRELKDRLEEAGFKVFLDQAGYTAGMDLRRETSRQVRKSRKIVVVGRPGALASEWVQREVEIAQANGKTPAIINVNGAVQAARDSSRLAAVALENHWRRLDEQLADGESLPSDHAIAELVRSFRATRQETKRQRIIATAASILAVTAAVAIWQALVANSQRQIAVINEHEADRQRIAANQSAALAKASALRAKRELDNALVTQSRFLADVALRKVAEGDRQTALLLALEALPDQNATEDIRRSRPYVPEPAIALDKSWRAPGQIISTFGLAGDSATGQFSADGSSLLITSGDVRMWDTTTGAVLLDSDELDLSAFAADFAFGGKQLLLLGADKLVGWDVRSRRAIYSIAGIQDYMLSRNNLFVTRSSDNTVAVRDIKTGRQLCEIGQNIAQLPVLSSSGDQIVTWQENTIQFWETRTCRSQGRPITLPKPIVKKVEVNAAGTRVAVPLANDTISLWDVPNRRLLWTVEGRMTNQSDQKLLSPDNKKLIAFQERSVSIIDISSGRPLLTIPRESAEDSDVVAFSPNSQNLLYVPDLYPCVPKLWTLAKNDDGNFVADLVGHEKFVEAVSFSPDEKNVLTASNDGTSRLWDVATGKLRALLNHDSKSVAFATFSPDNMRVAIASAKSDSDPRIVVRTWDITEGRRRSTTDNDAVTVETSPPDPRADEILRQLTTRSRKVLAVSRDDMRAVIHSDTEGPLLWDVEGNKVVAALEGHRGTVASARFSADGLRLLTVAGEQEKITGDGETDLLDQWDNEVRVWDAETGHPLAVVSLHQKSSWTAQFADGGILTSSASDGKQLWKYFSTLQDFIEHVKAIAPRCLDARERRAYFLDAEPPRWCPSDAKRHEESQAR